MAITLGFERLFQSMNMVTVCLWVTGLVLFCVEFFQPMRGVAYALGVALIGAAFVTSTLYGSAGEAYAFVFITALIIFAVHVVSLFTQKRDWLRVSRMEKAGERTRRYGNLIDSVGVANTAIDLTGNATVNDINLVVYSHAPIACGESVRIVEITNDKIIVERVDPADLAE